MNKSYKWYHFCKGISLLIFFTSCKKFVESDPPKTALISETVFSSDATATAAITGIYSRMMQSSSDFLSGENSITLLSGLSSDELKNYSTDINQIQFYTSSLSPSNSRSSIFWTQLYQYIYSANSVIEGIAKSKSLSPQLKKELTGEAKFFRAFCYFYLTNLFGDVQILTSTDYSVNAHAFRSPKSEVYQQIVNDLNDAKDVLPDNYTNSGGQRTRANKWAGTALLSRVYLYMSNWSMAETEATLVINNNSTYNLVADLDQVFLKNSNEAILQFSPVVPFFETFDGFRFILSGSPRRVALNDGVLSSFETGDNRKPHWVGTSIVGAQTYYFPYKYKLQFTGATTTPPKEYLMILRLAEQYLIRAEARAELNDIPGAQADLNTIRNRAGLFNSIANTKASLLLAIEQERRVEMFCEMGHRWLDLKRTNRANVILEPLKGSNWQPTDVLYPIPQSEISLNSNIVQNPGY
jgi:hypothetical protein